jgi:valyl-tRNA synthetase
VKLPQKSRSIHKTSWPSVNRDLLNGTFEREGDLVVAVISAIRRLKSEKGTSLKSRIRKLGIYSDDNERNIIQKNSETIIKTCNIQSLVIGDLTETQEGLSVEGYSTKIREEDS